MNCTQTVQYQTVSATILITNLQKDTIQTLAILKNQ